MECPKCDGGDLDWVLTACEFKCSVCGNTFTFTDLKDLGYIDSEFKCPRKVDGI